AALGVISPLFGSLADTRGRRIAALVGLGLFALGMALVAVWPTYPALVAGLLLASAAKLIFEPAMQAYVGDRVPYVRRGRALALTELSWSFAFLLGMPLIGRSEEHTSELQSRENLVCRLLLEKKKNND